MRHDSWGWRTGGSRFGRDPPDFNPDVPGLLDVAWHGPMACLKEQRSNSIPAIPIAIEEFSHRELGEEEPEKIQREELVLARWLIMVPRGRDRAQ